MISSFFSRVAARVFCSFLFAISTAGLPPALAHEGHDHGAAMPILPATVKPRIALQTESYELVGIASGDQLAVFLDRFGSNIPVTDAAIEILSGADTIKAEPKPDGSYRAKIASLAAPGKYDLVFNVAHKEGDDLLAGTLEVPSIIGGTAAPQIPPPGFSADQRLWFSILGLIAGLILGMVLKPRRATVPIWLCAAALVMPMQDARAHDGHEASPAPSSESFSGDVPRRLADGSVFLPKASQRLLTVRTQIAIEGEANRGATLVGRIISDPNRSGLVQSVNGGRVSAPDSGLPRLGQTVKKGDILATVIPALPLADQSTIAEKQRELEGARLLVEQKLARLNKLGPGIAPRSQIDDAELEAANLERRMSTLKDSKIQPEILTAPVDGVISASRVVAGQVVQAQDILFQIVDPQGLWVEAHVFDQIDPGTITEASAITPDNTVLKLTYVGRGRALQQQAIQLQFAIDNAPASVALGMPVTVIAKKAQNIRGMLFPRDAIVRGTGGETIVWQHVEPERFVARPVRVEPFDGEQLLVTAGISAKDRIVVHGAELLSQVR